MEAKGERLSMLDIAKLYCRKFLRLAPSYYGIWLLEWSFSSRFCLGKLCYRTNDLYITCNKNWIYTFFWVANLNLNDMKPWSTCYQ